MVEGVNAQLRGTRGKSPVWRLLYHFKGICSNYIINVISSIDILSKYHG